MSFDIRTAQVGSTITFQYYGGTTPGRSRTVEVVEHVPYSGYIVGKDIYLDESDNIRNFSYDKIRFATLITPPVAQALAKSQPKKRLVRQIYFADARKAIASAIYGLTGEQLAEAYGKYGLLTKGETARYNSREGTVVIEAEQVEPTMAIQGNSVILTNEHGETVKVNANGMNPRDLLEMLKKHLDK